MLRVGVSWFANRCKWSKIDESFHCGRVAQLGEHLLCKQGVAGSNPVTSTIFFSAFAAPFALVFALISSRYVEIWKLFLEIFDLREVADRDVGVVGVVSCVILVIGLGCVEGL
jgi:hypothetical protein